MGFRIVIAGVSQCNTFSEICLLADYLQQNLPNFCFERIEKNVVDWTPWLTKINKINDWHHTVSPLVWKELLISGSKPIYIGSTQDFLEYCYSYYNFDVFLAIEKFKNLPKRCIQHNKSHKIIKETKNIESDLQNAMSYNKANYTICISGASNYLTMYVISGLLDLCKDDKNISKIYIYDKNCLPSFMKLLEKECSYIDKNHAGKVVKYAEKIGTALTNSDVLIILDHLPFQSNLSIGAWLAANKAIMENIAVTINICASSNMRIIFPNLGPACYNATILATTLTNIKKNNIVVATSDLGMEIAGLLSEVAEVPLKNMYCPPVWGFVGINHLVDVNTTIHRYDAFMPFDRYTKVNKSTLCIGTLTPEMRTFEYLMYFDESLWKLFADTKKSKHPRKKLSLNKAVSLINVIRIWLFDANPDYIINLGISCDGSFGLHFRGFFSQPAKLVNEEWTPAKTFLLPKDPQMNIYYLQNIADMTLKFSDNDLPPIISYTPCVCKSIR